MSRHWSHTEFYAIYCWPYTAYVHHGSDVHRNVYSTLWFCEHIISGTLPLTPHWLHMHCHPLLSLNFSMMYMLLSHLPISSHPVFLFIALLSTPLIVSLTLNYSLILIVPYHWHSLPLIIMQGLAAGALVASIGTARSTAPLWCKSNSAFINNLWMMLLIHSGLCLWRSRKKDIPSNACFVFSHLSTLDGSTYSLPMVSRKV